MQENEFVNFSYTGSVQSFTVPDTGTYKFECYGAGSAANGAGGWVYSYGGLATGYKFLTRGTILYVCVGGSNGYNGGGKGDGGSDGVSVSVGCSYGGGATHIATTNRGILSSYNSYQSEVLLVAGGAGGCASGNSGSGSTATVRGGSGGTGGGYQFGQGRGATSSINSSGYLVNYGPGGGGGWSGGAITTSSGSNISGCATNGGTSYTGGCPSFTYLGTTYSPSASAGVGTAGANGSAKITLVRKHPAAKRLIAC